MAEFIMKDLVKKAGLEKEFRIASAAVSTEEIWNGVGSPIYGPAQDQLRKHSIPFDKGKRARLLVKEDYDRFDYLIGMDGQNIRRMNRLFSGDPEGKVNLLLAYGDRVREVSDPWYTRDFDLAYRDILDGCEGLLRYCTGEAEW